MDRDPNVYDHERLHSPNGGLQYCEGKIVDAVVLFGTDVLEKRLQDFREGIYGQEAAPHADALLADFARLSVLDDFRKIEAPMQAAYEAFVEAKQKREDARLATEQATSAWEVPAEGFRPKLEALGRWAESADRAQCRRVLGIEPLPGAYLTIVGTSSWLKNPGDFVKYRDAVFHEIDFIREKSEIEYLDGRLEQPLRMSDFESSLKELEAAQACVEARQNEEADAKEALEAKRLKFCEERQKAIEVLHPLSNTGQWALFRLVRIDTNR